MEDLRKLIVEALADIADCKGYDCQINLASTSAQEMIAKKISHKLNPHIMQMIEDVICPERLEK